MNDNESVEDQRQSDIANCYRICRNFQDYGAKTVMSKIKHFFHDKSDTEIMELIVEVEKLTSQSSKPIGY